MKKIRSIKLHKAWLMVFLCFLTIISGSLLSAAVATNLSVIRSAWGYTATQVSFTQIIKALVSLPVLLVINRLMDKFKLEHIMGTALLLDTLALALIAFFGDHLTVIYIAFALAGFAGPFCWIIPGSIIVNNWMVKDKGIALSAITAGSGVCSLIWAPAIQTLFSNYGFKATFLSQAAYTIIVAALVFLLLRENPQDYGLEMYGIKDYVSEEKKPPQRSCGGFHANAGLLILALFFIGASSGPSSSNLSLLFCTLGLDPGAVSKAIAVYGLFLTIGKLLCGKYCDHSGPEKMTWVFGATQLIAFVLCTLSFFCRQYFYMYLCIIFYSFGAPVQNLGYPNWALDFSTKENYMKLYQSMAFAYSVGDIFGAFAIGKLADLTGYYNAGYLLFLIAMSIGLLIPVITYRKKKRYLAAKEK